MVSQFWLEVIGILLFIHETFKLILAKEMEPMYYEISFINC